MDDDTIKRLAVQSASADIDLQVNFGNGDAIKRFARACYVEGQRDAQARIAELEQAADNALGVLLACCVPAGGVDDRAAILDAQRMLRALLAKRGAA